MKSPVGWLGIALAVAGVIIDVTTTSYVVGTFLIVIGVLLLALAAGKGRKKGSEEDH